MARGRLFKPRAAFLWLLSMLANKAKALVEKQGKLMLEKPVKPSITRS
jgi:hypothetical protein